MQCGRNENQNVMLQLKRRMCIASSIAIFHIFVEPQQAHSIFTFAHHASKGNSSGLFILIYHSGFLMIYHMIVRKQT